MSTGRVVSHWDVPEQFLIVQWLGAMELTLHLQMCPGAWVRPPIPHTGGTSTKTSPLDIGKGQPQTTLTCRADSDLRLTLILSQAAPTLPRHLPSWSCPHWMQPLPSGLPEQG